VQKTFYKLEIRTNFKTKTFTYHLQLQLPFFVYFLLQHIVDIKLVNGDLQLLKLILFIKNFSS